MNKLIGNLSKSPEWYQNRLKKIDGQKEMLVRMSQHKEKKYKHPGKSFKLKSWKVYWTKVWQLTKQQDLNSLPGFEKRDFNSWQLDHKVSVADGYFHDIPETMIADISNLRIIAREENLKKAKSSIPEDLTNMLKRLNR